MKRFLSIIALMMLVTATAASSNDQGHTRDFIGLWEAVDPADGSLTQRSITCDRDGACSVLGSDSFWIVCGSPRGVLRGEGSVTDGLLNVPGFTLTCTNGPVLTVATTFVPDRRNRTLVEEHANPNIQPITFHRVSR